MIISLLVISFLYMFIHVDIYTYIQLFPPSLISRYLCLCQRLPPQSTDRTTSIRYARPREPSMLGNIRKAEHLQEEVRAPPTAQTAGTDVRHPDVQLVFQPHTAVWCSALLTDEDSSYQKLQVKGQREAVTHSPEENCRQEVHEEVMTLMTSSSTHSGVVYGWSSPCWSQPRGFGMKFNAYVAKKANQHQHQFW